MVAVVTGARDAHGPPRATPAAAPADNRPVRRPPHRTRTPPIAPCRKAMHRASLREQPRVTTTTGRPSLDALARIRTETPCGTAPSRQRVYQFHHQGGRRKIETFRGQVQPTVTPDCSHKFARRIAFPHGAMGCLRVWRRGRGADRLSAGTPEAGPGSSARSPSAPVTTSTLHAGFARR